MNLDTCTGLGTFGMVGTTFDVVSVVMVKVSIQNADDLDGGHDGSRRESAINKITCLDAYQYGRVRTLCRHF